MYIDSISFKCCLMAIIWHHGNLPVRDVVIRLWVFRAVCICCWNVCWRTWNAFNGSVDARLTNSTNCCWCREFNCCNRNAARLEQANDRVHESYHSNLDSSGGETCLYSRERGQISLRRELLPFSERQIQSEFIWSLCRLFSFKKASLTADTGQQSDCQCNCQCMHVVPKVKCKNMFVEIHVLSQSMLWWSHLRTC